LLVNQYQQTDTKGVCMMSTVNECAQTLKN